MNDTLTKRIWEIADEFADHVEAQKAFRTQNPLRNSFFAAIYKLATDPVLRDSIIAEYIERLPANWFEDASLETWFPMTAETEKKLRERIAELEGYLAGKDSELAEANRAIENFVTLIQERNSELLALKAQVSKMRDELKSKVRADGHTMGCTYDASIMSGPEGDFCDCGKRLNKLLSSSPGPGLWDRVVKALTQAVESAKARCGEIQEGSPVDQWEKLLTDLGTTNPEQPK